MTNKKDPAKDIDAEVEFTCPCGKTTNLDYIIKHERKVLIDFILESGLLEERSTDLADYADELEFMQAIGHNTEARAIKEFMSNMDGV